MIAPTQNPLFEVSVSVHGRLATARADVRTSLRRRRVWPSASQGPTRRSHGSRTLAFCFGAGAWCSTLRRRLKCRSTECGAWGPARQRLKRCTARTVVKSTATASTATEISTSGQGSYNGADIDARFASRPQEVAVRFAQVTLCLGRAKSAWENHSLSSGERGKLVRKELASLGPVFAKLSQTLATRPDIVGRELAKELSLLQDAMTTFDDSVALRTIREEFENWPGPLLAEAHEKHHHTSEDNDHHIGTPLFKNLSSEPVAAASLAQVYQGTLMDGTLVAVKVQRPGLLDTLSLDVYVLRLILAIVNSTFRITQTAAIIQGVLDEVGDGLFAEVDFVQEATNIERFRELYGARCPNVVVPDVVWTHTRRRVMVTTWLHGRKPRDLSPEERLALVRLAAPCLSLQLMGAGFVHCDPHEGNMMLLDDGRLGLIDFGLMAQMTNVHQESMASAILNLIAQDYRGLAVCFQGMGVLNTDRDDLRRPGVEQPFAEALEEALSQGGRERRVQGGDSDRRRAFGQLYEELSDLAFRYYFTLPSYYVLVMRSFVTLEGIAFDADPDFNMYTTSYPFALRRMLTPRTQLGRKFLRKALVEDGRLKLFELLDDSPQRSSASTGVPRSMRTTGNQGDSVVGNVADVMFAPEGRELRRVLFELDSIELVNDLASSRAKPIRHAVARSFVTGFFGSLRRRRRCPRADAGASTLRRRRLVKKLALRHLWRSARKRPMRTAELVSRFLAACAASLVAK